jgi:hypothetical protein
MGANAAHILVVIIVADVRHVAYPLATGKYLVKTTGLV